MNNFEIGKDREEKINKFLDNLGWYFSQKDALDYTANAVSNLNKKIDTLNELFKETNKTVSESNNSSTQLSKALNRITLFGSIIAGGSLVVSIINLLQNLGFL